MKKKKEKISRNGLKIFLKEFNVTCSIDEKDPCLSHLSPSLISKYHKNDVIGEIYNGIVIKIDNDLNVSIICSSLPKPIDFSCDLSDDFLDKQTISDWSNGFKENQVWELIDGDLVNLYIYKGSWK